MRMLFNKNKDGSSPLATVFIVSFNVGARHHEKLLKYNAASLAA